MTDPTLDSLQAALDAVTAEVALFKTQVPTLEEQVLCVPIQCWSSSNSTPTTSRTSGMRTSLMVAPIPLKVLSVALAWEYWNIAASDTSYWQATLEIGDGPTGFPDVAVKTTQSTGANANGGVTARKAWTFDSAAWAPVDMNAGQLLAINWAPVGSPAAMSLPLVCTIRYAAR